MMDYVIALLLFIWEAMTSPQAHGTSYFGYLAIIAVALIIVAHSNNLNAAPRLFRLLTWSAVSAFLLLT